MKKILIITSRYLPGFKDGGPVRTVKNLIDNLGDEYTFTVMCADRDMGDTKPYDGIKADSLNSVDKAMVFYSADEKFKLRDIYKLCKSNDLAYVCGMYNGFVIKSLILKKLRLIKIPLVLAPMGTFSKGALAIKSLKKKVFFTVFRFFRMYKNVVFSVTSSVEESELRDTLKIDNKCYIAEDMPRSVELNCFSKDAASGEKIAAKDITSAGVEEMASADVKDKQSAVAEETASTNVEDIDSASVEDITFAGAKDVAFADKAPGDSDEFACLSGALKVVFISRICVKKNLTYAIDVLSQVNENVVFHIYGIIEDKDYYDKCLEKLKQLPENIKWEYKGELQSEDVHAAFSKYDVFLFPTMGENYGHVISEALAVGCIPVISDTTPWLDLEEKDCGYVTSLENRDGFIEKITHICKITSDELAKKSENARMYFEEKRKKAINESGYRVMFDELTNVMT